MAIKARRWGFGLVVVAAVVAWFWWQARPRPVAVTLAAVARGTVERSVANTRAGTVMACRRARLSPGVGGQIARLPVREGDRVEAGRLLLELWNNDLEAELRLAEREAGAARASARAACVRADAAARDAQRIAALRRQNLASEEQSDSAETAARAGAADCEAANALTTVRDGRIAVVRAAFEKTRLLAPFAGIVAEINGELSEYVTPSPPGIPTPPAVELLDTGCFYVAAPIDEVDVAGVELGQPARITLDAYGEREFPGRVRRIADYVLDVEKQARTAEVEVAFDDPGDGVRLLAGYSADVQIVLEVREDTLRIPTEAVIEGDHVYRYRPTDGTIERIAIETGTANWEQTEVRAGLAVGDRVVTSVDREGLADGVAVVAEADGAGE